MFSDINESNFLMYAMKCYESPHCITSEFESDLKRTKYLKRLFRRYKASNTLKERLIINHIILLNNVFGPTPTVRILFYKIDERDYDILKTFLEYLNLLPETVEGIKGVDIHTSSIPTVTHIEELLTSI